MLYVIQEKVTKKIKGTVEVADKSIADWKKNYKMTVKDESFRGKRAYQMKIQGNDVRLATQQEIDDYLATQNQQQQAKLRQDTLDIIGLTESDIIKIKNLP